MLTSTGNLQKLARAFESEQEAAIARGDAQATAARAADAIVIGRSMGNAASSSLLNQMVAIAIEKKAVQRLDPAQAVEAAR